MVPWDFEIEHRTLTHNAVTRPIFQDQGKKTHECTVGNQSDISNICNFGWHEWAHHHDFGSLPENKEKIGRILDPARIEVMGCHNLLLLLADVKLLIE